MVGKSEAYSCMHSVNGGAFKRCDWVPRAMIPTAEPTLLTMLDIFLLAWEPTATATAFFFVLPASRGDSTLHRWRTAQCFGPRGAQRPAGRLLGLGR